MGALLSYRMTSNWRSVCANWSTTVSAHDTSTIGVATTVVSMRSKQLYYELSYVT